MGIEKANFADTQIKIDADVEFDTTISSDLSPKTSDPQCQPGWIIVICNRNSNSCGSAPAKSTTR